MTKGAISKALERFVARLFLRLGADDIFNRLYEDILYRTRVSNNTGRFQILTYHKVSPDPHPFFEPLHPSVFEKQLETLKTHYRTFRLCDLVKSSCNGSIPRKAVSLTFDDGYKDNYTYAFPLLQKYEIPATVFLATGSIGTGRTLWHDRVFDSFRYATVKSALLDEDKALIADLTSQSAARRSLQLTLNHARSLCPEECDDFVSRIESRLSPDLGENLRTPMLSWSEIREMHAAGIDFASHTVTHPILSNVDAGRLQNELENSKANLEQVLGEKVVGFAYPNGHPPDFNDQIKRQLRELGYSYAVTAIPGFNTSSTDSFELRRGQPWQTDISLFRMYFFLQRRGWTW